MMALIQSPRSIIPACDVPTLEKVRDLVAATWDLPGIGGYKVGLGLVIRYGLPAVVSTIHETVCISDHENNPPLIPVIYDHQKGGNDIPELGKKFAEAVDKAGADAVILFPFSGITTLTEWVRACSDAGLHVLVGGHMTHKGFLDTEGGFMKYSSPNRIYEAAARLRVRDFVVPGNQVALVERYRRLLTDILGEDGFTLYAPGFVTQGGDISETGKVAGDRWHAIVGSAIYKNETREEMRAAALRLTQQIL